MAGTRTILKQVRQTVSKQSISLMRTWEQAKQTKTLPFPYTQTNKQRHYLQMCLAMRTYIIVSAHI